MEADLHLAIAVFLGVAAAQLVMFVFNVGMNIVAQRLDPGVGWGYVVIALAPVVAAAFFVLTP